MTLFEAIKEMTDNKQAKEISWPLEYTYRDGRQFGSIILKGNKLFFGNGSSIMNAGPKFLLRNDFSVKYEPKPLRCQAPGYHVIVSKNPDCDIISEMFVHKLFSKHCRTEVEAGIITHLLNCKGTARLYVTADQLVEMMKASSALLYDIGARTETYEDNTAFDLT